MREERWGAEEEKEEEQEEEQEEQEQADGGGGGGEPRWLLTNVSPAGNKAANPSLKENLTISFLPNAAHPSLVEISQLATNNQPTRWE